MALGLALNGFGAILGLAWRWEHQLIWPWMFLLGSLGALAVVASWIGFYRRPVREATMAAELATVVEIQRAETARVHLLLDVVTIANISESFSEASQSIADLLTRRFPVQSVRVYIRPDQDSSLERITESRSTELDPPRLSDDLKRTYPIRMGPEELGEIRIEGEIFEDLDSDMHHVFLGIASHIAQVALREQAANLQLNAARTDELSGLPNRRGFRHLVDQAIERADAHEHKIAVLYIDLNGFKGVNDTFGHDVGDEVLRVMSRRLSKTVRLSDALARNREPGEYVSRLGGDEFSVILDEIQDANGPEIVARRIVDATMEPISIESHSVELGASVGVALYPDDATSRDQLMQCADVAMYSAKNAEGCGYQRFSKEDEEASSTFLLAQDLRGALDAEQLQFYMQPVFDAKTGNLIAAETLARWEHPEHGWIPPDRFIGVAENTGLIKRLGRFVLLGAYQWLRDSANRLPEGFRISVNVSARQLEDPEFSHEVAMLVAESPLEPSRLELEVTETMLLNDRPGLWQHIRALSSIGVSFALDDFGTGYSSLSLLKKLPIARIKIDQSFIRGLPDSPEDQAIVNAILGMADSMNLPTLAEGVEDEAQFEYLAERGCDEIQGFFLGRPGPPDEILRIHEDRLRSKA